MNLIIFDTETTGLKPGQICQLSYIVAQDKNRGQKFLLVDQSQQPSPLQRTGSAKLSGGKDLCIVTRNCCDFSHADRVVAHNYAFDNRFIRVT